MDFLPSVVWKIFADVGTIEFGSLTLGNQFLIVALIYFSKNERRKLYPNPLMLFVVLYKLLYLFY
jgi:hypothetical protein